MGHIHVCDVSAAPCDDPEDQMVVAMRQHLSIHLIVLRKFVVKQREASFLIYCMTLKLPNLCVKNI
jgi:hypothetical protein